jgi:hypothetical protein
MNNIIVTDFQSEGYNNNLKYYQEITTNHKLKTFEVFFDITKFKPLILAISLHLERNIFKYKINIVCVPSINQYTAIF